MLRKIKRYFKSFILSYRKIPDKKVYVEFFTAMLTIPMLVTVILINLNNLKNQNAPKQQTKTETERVYVEVTPTDLPQPSISQGECNSNLPPVTITSPSEGQTVTDNPVCVDISYQKNNYCSVVWSYRINGGDWSDYDDKSVCLYNLPSGNVSFDLRVKSVASGDDETVRRTFIYKNNSVVITPTLSQEKTSSGSAQ